MNKERINNWALRSIIFRITEISE